MKKPTCPRGCKNLAIIDKTLGILPCAKCRKEDEQFVAPTTPEFYNMTKIQRVQQQRDMHDGDILQPYKHGKKMNPSPDFVRAYPEKARDYFSDEQLEKL